MLSTQAFDEWLDRQPDFRDVISTSRSPEFTRQMLEDAFDAGWCISREVFGAEDPR